MQEETTSKIKTTKRQRVDAIIAALQEPEVVAELLDLDRTERFAFLQVVADAFKNPIYQRTWRPTELWRENKPTETARAFLQRVYLMLPYDQRPFTHELSHPENGDRPFYNAVTMLLANNERLQRTGPAGSVNAVRSLEELFPMIPGNGRKQRDLPDAFDAILYVSKHRGKSRSISASGRKRAPK